MVLNQKNLCKILIRLRRCEQSHLFQKLDEILQDEIVAATMALSLLVRRCVKPYIFTPHLHKNKTRLKVVNTSHRDEGQHGY